MRNAVIKLKDVIDRDVSAREAPDVVDYLLACLTHVTNARPLFGVLNTVTDELEWTAGGAGFFSVLQSSAQNQNDDDPCVTFDTNTMTMAQLFACFKISDAELTVVLDQMHGLSPGAGMSLLQPMVGIENMSIRMVMRRRPEPFDGQVQFSLFDITPFQASAKRTQKMAQILLADMAQPLGADGGASDLLHAVVDGLEVLFALNEDAEIAAMAQNLSAQVTTISERIVAILGAFEGHYDIGHWQPDDLNPTLRPIIPVHSAPVDEWVDHRCAVMTEVDGLPAVRTSDTFALKQAYDFVQNAANVMVISPQPGRIFVLNGTVGGQSFSTVEDFVSAIRVEENSTHTAVDYFKGLSANPGLGVFAVAGQNIEVWGRPVQYGGWQAMLVADVGRGVDVRGLFHGLKNLLLHLQVLYVVHTSADVDHVRAGLKAAGRDICQRLKDLSDIACTGRRDTPPVKVTVGKWLDSVRRVAFGDGCEVLVEASDLNQVSLMAYPGEMEDTLEELVRNAIQHGAGHVHLTAMRRGHYLCISVTDDGRGMTDEKLQQLHRVLANHAYDAHLSTRKDGTGNGLLAAENVVSSFVDGHFEVAHGPQRRGVEIKISMKLVD